MSDAEESSDLIVGYDISLRVELRVPKGKEAPSENQVGKAIEHELGCIDLSSYLGFEVDLILC